MGVNKDSKIFYLYNCTEGAFTGTVGTSGSANPTGTVDEGKSMIGDKSFTYRNKADDADVTTYNDPVSIFKEIRAQVNGVTQDPNTKDAYPETILPLVVHASVDAAKAAIFDAAVLTAFDTHCDNVSWGLVDGDKGLKMTRDWKIETDPTADDHKKQFKDAMDGRWASDTYLKVGGILTDSDSHLF